MLRTRPPRRWGSPQPVRLACVRHAASVDPEPGSNSPPSSTRHVPRPSRDHQHERHAHHTRTGSTRVRAAPSSAPAHPRTPSPSAPRSARQLAKVRMPPPSLEWRGNSPLLGLSKYMLTSPIMSRERAHPRRVAPPGSRQKRAALTGRLPWLRRAALRGSYDDRLRRSTRR